MKIRFAMLLTAAVTGLALMPNTALAQTTPTQAEVSAAQRSGRCADPWISIAIAATTGGGIPVGRGDEDQCNKTLYNNGSWSTYQDLYRAVDTTLRNMKRQGVEMQMRNGAPALVAVDLRAMVANGLIGHDGATLIGNAGGTIAEGWGSIVAAGGGNVADRTHLAVNERVAVRLPSGKTLFVRIKR